MKFKCYGKKTLHLMLHKKDLEGKQFALYIHILKQNKIEIIKRNIAYVAISGNLELPFPTIICIPVVFSECLSC